MSGRGEPTMRKIQPYSPTKDSSRNEATARKSLAEETQRVIKEAEKEIARSIQREFDAAN